VTIAQRFLAELDHESQATRRVLGRVPQGHLSWRPHPKSWTLGQLALHVATVPGIVADMAAMDTLLERPAFVQAQPASVAELVPALDASIAQAKQKLGGFDDAAMNATWRLMHHGKELMAMPRATFTLAPTSRIPPRTTVTRRMRRRPRWLFPPLRRQRRSNRPSRSRSPSWKLLH